MYDVLMLSDDNAVESHDSHFTVTSHTRTRRHTCCPCRALSCFGLGLGRAEIRNRRTNERTMIFRISSKLFSIHNIARHLVFFGFRINFSLYQRSCTVHKRRGKRTPPLTQRVDEVNETYTNLT